MTDVSKNGTPLWLVALLMLLVVLGPIILGIVKFMAWWRVAFGACHG